MVFKRLSLKSPGERGERSPAARNNQGGFGQPVTRVEGFPAESARLKHGDESLYRVLPDRFSAIEGDTPTAQVKAFALFSRDVADAQLVRKVRPSAGGASVTRDGGQPAKRLLQKSTGRHENAARADVERLKDVPNEPHVM